MNECKHGQQARVCEMCELESELTRLRDLTCGKCGRSLAPDGDCHGCRADLLEVEMSAATEMALRRASEIGSLKTKCGELQLADAGRWFQQYKAAEDALDRLREKIPHVGARIGIAELERDVERLEANIREEAERADDFGVRWQAEKTRAETAETDLADTEFELEAVEANRKKWVRQFIPAEMYEASDHDEDGEALLRWRKRWDELQADNERLMEQLEETRKERDREQAMRGHAIDRAATAEAKLEKMERAERTALLAFRGEAASADEEE